MDLRERLRRVGAGAIVGAEQAPAPRAESATPGKTQPPLEALVDGEWVRARHGRCYRAEHVYPPDHVHGGQRLDALLHVPSSAWPPFLGRRSASIDLRDALFLDTETTGLARDAATYIFLVGLGSYTDEGFSLRQYFMPDYGDEEALLALLAEDLESRHGLVSYNGRGFDWPLVRTRLVLSGRALGDTPPHLDLLPLARRLWRNVLSSCSLKSVEENVLRLRRSTEDVPGYLIPQLYADYVTYGYAPPMANVFYHNEMDILSLVALATRIGELLITSVYAEGEPCQDYGALGRLYEHLGRTEDALSAYRRAPGGGGEASGSGPHVCSAQLYHAKLLKRLGRHDEAMRVWQQQLGGAAIEPYVELAKQYEHRLRDYVAARRIVLEAMDWVRTHSLRLGPVAAERTRSELEHRLTRLLRRIERAP